MNNKRKELLEAADAVGLILGEDFNKTIKSGKLQEMINEKKEELLKALQGETNESIVEESKNETTLRPLSDFNTDEELEAYGLEFGIDLDRRESLEKMYLELVEFVNSKTNKEVKPDDNETVVPGADDEVPKEENNYEDEINILRTSPCKNYRVPIVGLKECARRSDITVEEVKESIESGEPVNGWTFSEIK